MTIKTAISAAALTAALLAGPAFAQTEMMIGTQTVTEADVEAVKARCMDLTVAAETESLVSDSDSDADSESEDDAAGSATAGNAEINNEPETDAETATTVDLDIITLADCEAAEWTHDAM